jgi:hypothetical protein
LSRTGTHAAEGQRLKKNDHQCSSDSLRRGSQLRTGQTIGVGNRYSGVGRSNTSFIGKTTTFGQKLVAVVKQERIDAPEVQGEEDCLALKAIILAQGSEEPELAPRGVHVEEKKSGGGSCGSFG